MRITPGMLHKYAKHEAAQRVRKNRHLVSIYLTGSLISDSPLLGGVTDIDLIVVHSSTPEYEREIVRLSDEIHFDIAHYSQQIFRDTRQLRVNPWLGSSLCADPIVLHDSGHWFDFIQASVCAHFNQSETRLQRIRPLFEDARERWFSLSGESIAGSPHTLYSYLKALENGANAIAMLARTTPLTERRFMLWFPERVRDLGCPELGEMLQNLFTSEAIDSTCWEAWLDQWENTYLEVNKQENAPVQLHNDRLNYYKQTIEVMKDDYPSAAVWLLLRTWTLAVCHLSASDQAFKDWQNACSILALDADQFGYRLNALDTFLDHIEEELDQWALARGITPLSERI